MNVVDVIWIIAGYLIGSVSFAIVIGKVFFHKDVREYGSGNPGATNAGRAFGFKAFISVVLFDSLKAFLVMALAKVSGSSLYLYAGFAAVLGHCYPIYYRFKGGKAVSSSLGFLLGLCLFDSGDIIFTFVYPVLILLLMLGLFKMMSLASITSVFSSFIITWITSDNTTHIILTGLVFLLVVYRHKENIKRIIAGKESKLKLIK